MGGVVDSSRGAKPERAPQTAESVALLGHLRVLLMGFAKVGKTTSSIKSLVDMAGDGYVIECGDKSSLAPAARQTKRFSFDVVRDESQMELAIREARQGAKAGKYGWILLDDLSIYAQWLEVALRDASARSSKNNEPNPFQYWPAHKERLINIVARLFDAKCHFVCTTHYMEPPAAKDGQRAKHGEGIVPLIGGSARELLPAYFSDVLFMEKVDGKRSFVVNPEGVYGPGCQSTDESVVLDASFKAFWEHCQRGSMGLKEKGKRR
jgi:hypothetical protein